MTSTTHTTRWLPLPAWLRDYQRADLRGDLIAGLTTSVMLIPQGMAYAMLAGLPPIVGLYASIAPLVLYALFGSSRQLAVGPVAMVSLLVAAGVGAIAEQGTEAYLAYAVLLALMVGAIQLGMGLLRAGFLVNFMSHPVISGFTSAAALIIGLSQLKHLLGLDLPRSHHIHTVLLGAAERLGEVHLATLLLGAGAIAALLLLKRWRPTFPGALLVVVAGTLAVVGLDLSSGGVAIVGEVPGGLPDLGLPPLEFDSITSLLPTALTIALVGFMESVSVAKAFARRNRYEIDPNRELIGLGVANLGGALTGGYPVTGGFSRTAVNAAAGARTGLAALVTAGMITLTLLFLTPLFTFLPKAALAAIIMTAVFGLVDLREVAHLWKVKRSDLALLVLTFVATLSLGIEEGILTGVVASLLWFVVRTTRPHTAVLGRLPGSEVYRNLENFPEATARPGVLAVRVDAQFYFGNVTFLKDELRRLEEAAATTLCAVVVDASSINNLDSSADAALHEIAEGYEERGVQLHFATVKGPVREVMARSGFTARLGDDHFHEDLAAAMAALTPLLEPGHASEPAFGVARVLAS